MATCNTMIVLIASTLASWWFAATESIIAGMQLTHVLTVDTKSRRQRLKPCTYYVRIIRHCLHVLNWNLIDMHESRTATPRSHSHTVDLFCFRVGKRQGHSVCSRVKWWIGCTRFYQLISAHTVQVDLKLHVHARSVMFVHSQRKSLELRA